MHGQTVLQTSVFPPSLLLRQTFIQSSYCLHLASRPGHEEASLQPGLDLVTGKRV